MGTKQPYLCFVLVMISISVQRLGELIVQALDDRITLLQPIELRSQGVFGHHGVRGSCIKATCNDLLSNGP